MRKLVLFPAAVLAAAMLCTSVMAQDYGPGPGGPEAHGWHHHHRHDGAMMALRQLDLSEAQKASVKQLVKASHEQFKPQFEALRSQRQAFNAATPGSAAFQSAAAGLAQAESAAAGARVQQQAALRTQIYNLLSDAQKAQLANLQAQHQARLAQWQAQHPQAQSSN